MTLAKVPAVAIPSFDKIKMEERKRSLAADVDDLVPRKKAKGEDGAAMRMDAEKERAVEDYQKDAILRQMKEYKRQKNTLEEEVAQLSKKSTFHDDHLRTIDAWFAQLLDEVRLLAQNALPMLPPTSPAMTGKDMFQSALFFEDFEVFTEHLDARSKNIKAVIEDLFGKLPGVSPEIKTLQERMVGLLAAEKAHIVESQRITQENDSLNERLEAASYRYMLAEKKLDRAKSAQVQKLERQAIMGQNGEASSPTTGKKGATPKKEHAEMNGDLENGVVTAEVETARKEAIAAADMRKAQLDQLELQNERLTSELSTENIKLASLTDDDYASTSLFKVFKSQHECVIARVNDLEATNKLLREEAQKLQAERTAYKSHVDEEHRAQTNEIENQWNRAESDLARIRNSRDELIADLAIKKSGDEQRLLSVQQAQELAESRDSRITALESEVERLKLQVGVSTAVPSTDLDGLDAEALKSKLRTLESQHAVLSNELPSMESAWRKAQALASRKVTEIIEWEEKIARLSAEKVKADQKYFSAMKSKDAKESELRQLKAHNKSSADVIARNKEDVAAKEGFVVAKEKEVVESREQLAKLEQTYRAQEQKLKESTLIADGLRANVVELKKLIAASNSSSVEANKVKREAEVELEQLKVRLDETKLQLDRMRKARATAAIADSDDWRKVAICPVCNSNIRNTVLKLCGHVFCSSCVQDLISNRSRKCPSCGRGFGANDQMGIVLT